MEHPLSAPRQWLAGAAVMTSLGVFAPCAHAQDARAAAPPQRNEFVAAVGQPLADFNINQTEIPDSLRRAVRGPYEPLAANSCAAMVGEIADLDQALGPDLDVAAVKTTRRGRVSGAATGAIRRLSVSWIPMRGIVRTVTGAEAHARKVQDAALAGAVRRAYLKGLADRDGCAEAMPRRALVMLEIIETEALAIPPLDAPAQVVALDTP